MESFSRYIIKCKYRIRGMIHPNGHCLRHCCSRAPCISDSEFRNIPVPDRFRNRQTVLFREKRKKIGPKINLFSVEYLNLNTQGH